MLTQTMSTEDVQPIKNVQIESASIYLQFVKMSEHILTPTRESARSAGLTLRSHYQCNSTCRRKRSYTDRPEITLPDGYYGRIAPITDLASSNHICIGAGVIDADFRGNLSVLLFNVQFIFCCDIMRKKHNSVIIDPVSEMAQKFTIGIFKYD